LFRVSTKLYPLGAISDINVILQFLAYTIVRSYCSNQPVNTLYFLELIPLELRRGSKEATARFNPISEPLPMKKGIIYQST
jgi:hypothetical protein